MTQRLLPGFRSARAPVFRPVADISPDGLITVVIPGMKLVSEANAHEHWRVKAKRAKGQRSLTAMVLRSQLGDPPSLPLAIEIQRVGRGKLDSDNLQGSGKHVRDGIADWIGVDDGNDGYAWMVTQATGEPAVVIRIRQGGAR